MSRISVRIAFPHSTNSFRRGTLLCFRKFRVSKKFMDKGRCREGVSHLSANILLSHSSEKTSYRNLLLCHQLWVSKKFMFKRVLSCFSVEKFLSRSAQNVRRRTVLCFRKLRYRKILCLSGEYHEFLKKICCLTVLINFVTEPFCLSQSLWYRKTS